MRKIILPILCLFLARLAMAQTPVTFTDNFNDQSRDPAKWYKALNEDILKEEGKVLHFYSKTNDLATVILGANFFPRLNKGDALNATAKVHVPHRMPEYPDGIITNWYELGLGFRISTNMFDTIELTVADTTSNRQFGVYYLSESLTNKMYRMFPAPQNMTNYYLRLSYSHKTDLFNFFWSPTQTGAWTKICSGLKRTDLFQSSKPLQVLPYVVGHTENVIVPPDWNVWLDRCAVEFRNLPR